MTDYEKIYQKDANACGKPFPEYIDFFNHIKRKRLNVLDLGCGQGRDTLYMAKKEHSVFGVDISKTGISQMLENAINDKLQVNGMVADILSFVPSQNYDVAVMDRILHMLKDDEERIIILKKICVVINENGYVLISDVPKHKILIQDFFLNDQWKMILDNRNFTFVKKI